MTKLKIHNNIYHKHMVNKKNISPRLLTIMIIIVLLSFSQSKVYNQKISIPVFRRQGGWMFLDRMHVDPGNIKMQVKVKLIANNFKSDSLYDIEILAVPSNVWEMSLQKKCERQKFKQQQAKHVHHQEVAIHAQLYSGNQYTYENMSTIEVPKQQTYHFILRHCSKVLMNDGYGRDVRLQVYLQVTNNQTSHSSTQKYYSWLLPLLLIIGVLMLKSVYQQQQEENWLKWSLKYSLWIGIGSILMKYIGFIIYAYTSGGQSSFFQFMYMLLASISDSVIIVILLLLGYGWTVTFEDNQDFELYVPLACMLGLINVIMTMLNKISDGQHDKYHMYDTIPAYIMISFRLLGFLIFLGGSVKCLLSLKLQQHKMRKYFVELLILGTIYLTFIPMSLYLVKFIETKYRKEAMYFGVELVRYGLNIWLTILAISKKSTYRSVINKSFMEKEDKYL